MLLSMRKRKAIKVDRKKKWRYAIELLLLLLVVSIYWNGNYATWSEAYHGSWSQTPGPDTTAVQALFWSEPTQSLIAGSKVNQYRTGLNVYHPAAAEWIMPKSPLARSHAVMDFIEIESGIWAVYFSSDPVPGGLLISQDNGKTWQEHTELPGQPDPRCIVTLGSQNNTILVGTVSEGIFLSTDNGRSWIRTNTGLNNLRIQKLCADPFSLRTVFAGTIDSLYRSNDAGRTWFDITGNLSIKGSYCVELAANPMIQGMYYVILRDDQGKAHLLRSNDYCETWTPIMTGLKLDVQPRCITFQPHHPERLFLGTVHDGVYRSENNGTNWYPMNHQLPIDDYPIIVHDLLFVDGEYPVLYAATDMMGTVWEYRMGAASR